MSFPSFTGRPDAVKMIAIGGVAAAETVGPTLAAAAAIAAPYVLPVAAVVGIVALCVNGSKKDEKKKSL